MKPFEVLGSDGRVYLHHDNWHRWKHETLSVHPGEGKWRFDLDLRYPMDTLEEVPVLNSRVHTQYAPHTCFYECHDWSTIYDIYECGSEQMFRMIVESQNPEPIWGERITLFSTSTYFKCEPWGRNVPNQFAHFRGKYWQVNWSELLYHEFPAGVGYPLRDNGEFGVPRREVLRTAQDLIRVFGTRQHTALNAPVPWNIYAVMPDHYRSLYRSLYSDWPINWKEEGF